MAILMRTPGPYADESPRAYLVRLAEENGYDSQAVLFEMIEKSGQYAITVGWDYRKIQPLLGPLQILPDGFGYRAGRKQSKESAALLVHEVHPRHLGLAKARICPDCLTEHRYVPAWWDLKAFIACPVHGRMMLKNCRKCGVRIRYSRPGLLRCRCGADLGQMRGELASTELCALMEVLVAKVSGDHSAAAADASGLPTELLLQCDLAVLCRCIVGLSSVYVRQATRRRAPTKMREVAEFIPDTARALSCWPWNFYKLCGEWHRNGLEVRNSKYFQIHFSWLFTDLYKNLKGKRKQTLFLVEAALAYGLRSWDASPIRIKGDAAKIKSLPPRRFGTYTDVAEALGIPIYTVHRWLVKRKLPSKEVVGEGKRKFLAVDMEAVGNIKISASGALGQREAARFLGIPYGVYKALRREDLLQNSYLVDFDRGIAVEDLQEFKEKILSKTIVLDSMEGKFSFADTLDASITIDSKVAAINRILIGELSAYRLDEGGLRDIFLDVDLISQHREISRTGSEPLSVHRASIRYGLTFHEARAIFLFCTNQKMAQRNGRAAKLEATVIDGFLKQSIPLRRIAKDEGVSSIALRCLLEREAPMVLQRLPTGCRPARLPDEALGSFIHRLGVRKARSLARRMKADG